MASAAVIPPTPAEDLDDRIRALQREIDTLERSNQARQDLSRKLAENKEGPPDKTRGPPSPVPAEDDDEPFRARAVIDSRSVYVGQIDYWTTPADLAAFMSDVGTVNRVTIITDRWTGFPKGFGYVEYATRDAAVKAVETFNMASFNGRFLRVALKRTNVPWYIAKRYGGYEKVPWMQKARVAGSSGRALHMQMARSRPQLRAAHPYLRAEDDRPRRRGALSLVEKGSL